MAVDLRPYIEKIPVRHGITNQIPRFRALASLPRGPIDVEPWKGSSPLSFGGNTDILTEIKSLAMLAGIKQIPALAIDGLRDEDNLYKFCFQEISAKVEQLRRGALFETRLTFGALGQLIVDEKAIGLHEQKALKGSTFLEECNVLNSFAHYRCILAEIRRFIYILRCPEEVKIEDQVRGLQVFLNNIHLRLPGGNCRSEDKGIKTHTMLHPITAERREIEIVLESLEIPIETLSTAFSAAVPYYSHIDKYPMFLSSLLFSLRLFYYFVEHKGHEWADKLTK